MLAMRREAGKSDWYENAIFKYGTKGIVEFEREAAERGI
jgi:hypothetical protein